MAIPPLPPVGNSTDFQLPALQDGSGSGAPGQAQNPGFGAALEDAIGKLNAADDVSGPRPTGLEDLTGGQAPGQGQNSGVGTMLEDAVGKLAGLQNDATAQSQALATGQAQSIDSVVMSVERASLALELASQVRNKAVEAYQDLFRMQI
jgi:flagellar hook-basal body complex protein FliE